MPMSSLLDQKTFSVLTLGCRVNRYEAEAVTGALEKRGASLISEPGGSPDIVIAVTCSVTSTADAKTRKALRRARRKYGGAVIVACGCWAQAVSAADASSCGVDILVGNRVKNMIPDLLESWYGSPGAFLEKRTDVGPNRDWDDLSLDRPRLLTRAFIKVQDGCGRSCSYCAVPSLRGGPVSRDPGGVMEEISRVAASGVKEVILTGTQIGSYGHGGVTLAGLVRRISEAGEVSRLRLGSIEPFSVDGDFLKAAAESEIFCRHLHLPLQSGDDGVLSSMRRGYGSADFARVARMARDYLGDGLHISTDLIVGFPGESEAAFSRSLELLEELEIGRVHVFPHSRRRGTEASSMKEILGETVRERMERALGAAGRLIASYAAKRVGEDDVMLAEEIDKGVVSGWSTKYIRVCARNGGTENCLKGNELAVRPKISIGSILLCEGVGREQIVNYPDE